MVRAVDRGVSGRIVAFGVTVLAVVSVLTVFVGVESAGAVGGSGLTSLTPARLLDTRAGGSTVDGLLAGGGRLGAGSSLGVTVVGRGGVPGNALAAMLNVTAVGPVGAGYLTVFPCGSELPNASNLNFAAGETVPNSVFAKIGGGGQVCVYSSTTVDLIVDVAGYATADGPRPIVPARFLDTRSTGATADGLAARTGPLAGGSTLTLTVAGRPGVPTFAASVFLNVTAVAPVGNGYITVFPCGQQQPNASNLNFAAGQVVPNAVVAKVGSFGTICIFTTVTTDLLVDVDGYAIPGGPIPVAPARLLDTRSGGGTVDGAYGGTGRVAGGAVLSLQVAGRAGLPANAQAVMLNVTAANPAGPGFVTVYPCNAGRPNASNLNFVAGEVVPNAVFAKLDATGSVCLFADTAVDLLVDVNGYSTTYDASRWSHPTVTGWVYDGDGDGIGEEAWLNNDADSAYDGFGFDVDDDGDFDWAAFDLFNGVTLDAWIDRSRGAGVVFYFDLNEDGRFELALYDQNRDGYGEAAMADVDQNGLFEGMIADPGHDGTFELYARDTDGDGQADTWFTAQTAPRTAPQSLTGFYNTWAANLINYSPVFAGGTSAFGNFLNAYGL